MCRWDVELEIVDVSGQMAERKSFPAACVLGVPRANWRAIVPRRAMAHPNDVRSVSKCNGDAG